MSRMKYAAAALLTVWVGGCSPKRPTTVTQSPCEVVDLAAPVRAQLEAYNSHDLDAFLKHFARDVEVMQHPSGKVVARGYDEMRVTYAGLFVKHPKVHAEVTSRLVSGEYVVDHEWVTGRSDGEFEAIVIYQVRAGLISRVWFLPKSSCAKADEAL